MSICKSLIQLPDSANSSNFLMTTLLGKERDNKSKYDSYVRTQMHETKPYYGDELKNPLYMPNKHIPPIGRSNQIQRRNNTKSQNISFPAINPYNQNKFSTIQNYTSKKVVPAVTKYKIYSLNKNSGPKIHSLNCSKIKLSFVYPLPRIIKNIPPPQTRMNTISSYLSMSQ